MHEGRIAGGRTSFGIRQGFSLLIGDLFDNTINRLPETFWRTIEIRGPRSSRSFLRQINQFTGEGKLTSEVLNTTGKQAIRR